MKQSKDFWKGVVAGFILSLFVIYSFFRIYWIMEIGIKYFRWHAILWLYLSILLVFGLIGYYCYKFGKLKNELNQKKFLLATGLLMGFYLAEIGLRVTKIGIAYSETREGVYVNPAERMQKTWYTTYPPNCKIELKAAEYCYPRNTNKEGLSDVEWSEPKDTNEIRIMTLGDSFTEGDGCPFDSTYPNVLSHLLQSRFPQLKINVMNPARSGSDPWFEYKKLNDRLLKYKPDIVVYTNSTNDLFFDHLNYGGMERFAADSTVTNRIPQHWWLGLYEVSYVFRLFMDFAGYDNSLFGIGDREKNKIQALADARYISGKFSQLAVKNNFICVQLLRPEKNEIEDGAFAFNAIDLTSGTDTLPRYFTYDLLSYYRNTLKINRSNASEYYWKIDQHHNPKGYSIMAQAVYECIKPKIEARIMNKPIKRP